jgi:hypothetical protein
VSEKFISRSVDDNKDGLNVYIFVQVKSGGTSGLITDEMETL